MLAEFLVVAEHWLILRVLAMLSSCFGVVDCLPCGPSLDRITRRSCSVEVVSVRGPSLSRPSSAIDRLVGVISCWARASLVFCQLEVVVVSFTCLYHGCDVNSEKFALTCSARQGGGQWRSCCYHGGPQRVPSSGPLRVVVVFFVMSSECLCDC